MLNNNTLSSCIRFPAGIIKHATGGARFVALISLLILVPVLIFLPGCAIYATNPPKSMLPDVYDVVSSAEARTFVTTDDLILFGQWWVPSTEKSVKAVVLLVHGTNVHSGFYAPWAEELVENGYAVFGIDLRGWGQSQGHGRRGGVKDSTLYMEDLEIAGREIKTRFPDLPVFLQGESMGGAIVLCSQMGETVAVDGLILNAPAIHPSIRFWFLRAPPLLADFLLQYSAIPGDFFPNHPVLVPGFVPELLIGEIVKDKEVQARYKGDSHVVHKALPFSYLSSLRDMSAQIDIGLPFITTPLIILHGTDDALVPLSSSENAMKHLASSDKTLKVYEGMTHATLHDVGREKVWADIISWLDERSGGLP